MDILIDGNSLHARSFFAAQSRAHETGSFNPVQSVTMAMRSLLNILNPDYNRIGYQFKRMLVAWDGRQNPDKHREPKPAEYHEMRELFQDVLTLVFQAAHATHPDYEGDDILATAVYNRKDNDLVYIVSGDKDLMQLQGGKVRYYDLNQKAVLSERFITNRWHIRHPNQLAVALAIIGDPVDAIQGIPRYGPKKAEKLFKTVPPEADLEQAIDIIVNQIPEDLRTYFWESLDRTLLTVDVPGVPEPAPIEMAEPEVVDDLNLDLDGYYRAVWNLYTREPF